MSESELKMLNRALKSLKKTGVTVGHIILLLFALEDMKIAGRRVLCQSMSLGEGTTRTILGKLSSLGVIQVSKAGVKLSSLGRSIVSFIKSRISKPILLRTGDSLTLRRVNVALLIRDVKLEDVNVLKVRDDVIRFGGEGAVLLFKGSADLYIPPGNTSVSEKYPSLYSEIEETLQPEEGDMVLIGMGEEAASVTLAVLNAAICIVRELSGLFEQSSSTLC